MKTSKRKQCSPFTRTETAVKIGCGFNQLALCDENRFVVGFSGNERFVDIKSVSLSQSSFFDLFFLLTLFVSASTFLIVAINIRLIDDSLKTKVFVDLYNEKKVVERKKMKRPTCSEWKSSFVTFGCFEVKKSFEFFHERWWIVMIHNLILLNDFHYNDLTIFLILKMLFCFCSVNKHLLKKEL